MEIISEVIGEFLGDFGMRFADEFLTCESLFPFSDEMMVIDLTKEDSEREANLRPSSGESSVEEEAEEVERSMAGDPSRRRPA